MVSLLAAMWLHADEQLGSMKAPVLINEDIKGEGLLEFSAADSVFKDSPGRLEIGLRILHTPAEKMVVARAVLKPADVTKLEQSIKDVSDEYAAVDRDGTVSGRPVYFDDPETTSAFTVLFLPITRKDGKVAGACIRMKDLTGHEFIIAFDDNKLRELVSHLDKYLMHTKK